MTRAPCPTEALEDRSDDPDRAMEIWMEKLQPWAELIPLAICDGFALFDRAGLRQHWLAQPEAGPRSTRGRPEQLVSRLEQHAHGAQHRRREAGRRSSRNCAVGDRDLAHGCDPGKATNSVSSAAHHHRLILTRREAAALSPARGQPRGVIAPVRVNETLINFLIRTGWLAERDSHKRERIADAIARMIAEAERHP